MLSHSHSLKTKFAVLCSSAGSAVIGSAQGRWRVRQSSRRPLWLVLIALAGLPWQGAKAVMVTLTLESSQTNTVSMDNSTSPVQSVGALDTLGDAIGSGLIDGFIDDVVPLIGGEVGATFNSGTGQAFNTVEHLRPGPTPDDPHEDWESIDETVPLIGRPQVVAQEANPNGHQNTQLFRYDYGLDGLPGMQYYITGVVNDLAGGALSLGFTLPQEQFGLNIAGLDANEDNGRYLWINFYGEAGTLVDLLTVKIPEFEPTLNPDGSVKSDLGVAILSFQSTTPFYGITLTTDDPGGFATGDFRYTPLPTTTLLLLSGVIGMFTTRRYRRRAFQANT